MATQFDTTDFEPINPAQSAAAPSFDTSDFEPVSSDAGAQQFQNMYHQDAVTSPGASILPFGLGALKGFGEVGYGINKLGSRIYNALASPQNQIPLPKNPFQYNANANPVESYLSGMEKNYPTSSAAGEFAGQVAPSFALPLPNIAGALGKAAQYIPTAGKSIANVLGNRIVGNALNLGVTGAATAPIYNPELDPGTAATQAGIAGSLLGAAIPGGTAAAKVIKNIGGRFYDVSTANSDKAAAKAGQEFEDIYNKNQNLVIDPTEYRNVVQKQLSKLSAGSPDALNASLIPSLQQKLANTNLTQNDYPDIYSPRDVHQQLKGIGDQLKDSPNSEATKMLVQQSKALTQDMQNGLPNNDSKRWTDVMSQWGQNVVPLRANETSIPGIAQQSALLTAASHLPHTLGTMAGVALGAHGADSALPNLFKRFGSTYNGGIGSVLRGSIPQQGTLNNINRLLLPYLAGGNSQ